MEEYKNTVSEAARILNCSAESIRAYERKGKLIVLKTTGGMQLFRENDLRAFGKKYEATNVEDRGGRLRPHDFL